MRLNWLLLGSAILLEVIATLSLRAAAGFTHPGWYVPVVIGYLGAFWALSTILARGMPLGVAYGTWAATGIALVAVLGALIFGDALSWTTGIGIVLIIGGVLLLEFGSQKAMDRRRAAEPRIDGSGVNG
ncbi:DMT family transporter [Plantibacter sp. YIM 135347]|uniref:DMT family transporter n=1 Tax=Plantibacter sp. YIM 135347 TaxID=3423919 RepID=UPI003D3482A5